MRALQYPPWCTLYHRVFVSTLTGENQPLLLCSAVCPPGGKMAALPGGKMAALPGPRSLLLLTIGLMISCRATSAMTVVKYIESREGSV